ncbi:MAG: LacI family DNA-binding transcriptional regulator [Pseudomonadota bacterium]
MSNSRSNPETDTRSHASRPTMHDVAAVAGVSQMTVSRALRGEGSVSNEVKARVTQAARQLGYIHNRLASVQRGMENPMVAVILPTLKNTVFTDVLAGINDTLSAHNVRPVFGVSEYSQTEEENLLRDMLSWQPCGVILSGLEHSDGVRRALEKMDVRVAEVMDIDGSPMDACFGISQRGVGIEMAEHLLDRGYRRVAYLGSQGGSDLRAAKRFDAFKSRFADGGGAVVFEHVAEAPSSMALGRDLTVSVFETAPHCDAVYFSNDDLAAGGLMHCIASNVSVPEHIALAGFNGLPFLSALPQQITTTRTPLYDIGAAAALHVVGDDRGARLAKSLAHELIVGSTT